MARRVSVEERLRQAEALRHLPPGPESERGIRAALAERSALVVAAGARAAAAHRLDGLLPELLAALPPLYAKPVESDPRCHGKLALITALDELECDDPAPFLQAVVHRQPEPVWGGSEDSAPPLRIRAAQALVRLGRHDLYRILGDLLTDPVGEVRGAASLLLGGIGGERAILLLRLRVAVGEIPDEAAALGDHLAGLLACDGEASLGLAAVWLGHRERAVAAHAALAIGASRLAGGFALLHDRLQSCVDARLRRDLIEAISLLRSDPAAELLLELLAGDDAEDAVHAAKALRLYRDRPALALRVGQAIAGRKDARVSAAWEGATSSPRPSAPGRSGSRPPG